MEKNKNKRNAGIRGITLIALVITVIVMLILAAISITMLTGDNAILNRATQAKEKSKIAGTKEEIQMAVIGAMTDGIGQLKDATLRNELKNSLSGATDNDITGNEKYGWQVKVGNKAFAISKTGDVNEAFWEEIRDANGNVTEIKRVDGTVTGLKIGDTINYIATEGLDTENDTQMQISSAQTINGYENQVIDLRDYEGTWRLLGVEKGRLNIISSEITGIPKTDGDSTSNGVYTNSYFKLKGRTGYTNAEEELNRVCSIYGKGKNAEPGTARSINIEDINKITGYDPSHTGVNVNKATAEEIATGEPYGKNELYQYGNKVTYEWDGTDRPKYTSNITNGQLIYNHNWSTFKGFSWWDGSRFQKSDYVAGKSGKICELISNYYYYYPETLTINNNIEQSVGIANISPEREMLFNNTQYDTYWLASRCIDTNLDRVNFYIRCVGNDCVASINLHYSNGYEIRRGYGLRPIVSLKSDIKLKKDVNGVWQFVEK